jgi:cbb3-type cytochrome oxidase subunit 3
VSAGKKATGVAAGVGVIGTIISIWWFALRPRRKAAKARGSSAPGSTGA